MLLVRPRLFECGRDYQPYADLSKGATTLVSPRSRPTVPSPPRERDCRPPAWETVKVRVSLLGEGLVPPDVSATKWIWKLVLVLPTGILGVALVAYPSY